MVLLGVLPLIWKVPQIHLLMLTKVNIDIFAIKYITISTNQKEAQIYCSNILIFILGLAYYIPLGCSLWFNFFLAF